MDPPWMPPDPAFSVPTISNPLDGHEAVGAGQGQAAYAYIPPNAAGYPEGHVAHFAGLPTHFQGPYGVQSDAIYAPKCGYSQSPPPNPPLAPPPLPSPYSSYTPPAYRPLPAPSLSRPSPSAYYGPSLPLPSQQQQHHRRLSHPPSTPREAHLPVAPLPAAQHRPNAQATQYLHPPPPPAPRNVQPVDPGFGPQKRRYNQFDAVPAVPPVPPAAQYRPSVSLTAADYVIVNSAYVQPPTASTFEPALPLDAQAFVTPGLHSSLLSNFDDARTVGLAQAPLPHAPFRQARPDPPAPSARPPETSNQRPASSSAAATFTDDPKTASAVALAALRRAEHRALPSPLAGKTPRSTNTRNPASSASGSTSAGVSAQAIAAEEAERAVLRKQGKVNRNQQRVITSIEVLGRCYCQACRDSPDTPPGDGRTLARLVLRSLPPRMVQMLEQGSSPNDVVRCYHDGRQAADLGCWRAVGVQEDAEGVVMAGEQALNEDERAAKKKGDAGRYEDTLSAAIDQLDQLGLGEDGAQVSTSTQTASERVKTRTEYDSMLLCGEGAVPSDYKSETLRCDVCLFACGIGSVLPAFDDPANSLMTVEVICARCDALFKCCSDCGGGGGRLTPGRWRSRELFPLGRKTCTLSHARNPALGEVLIDVLSVADTPAEQLEDLVERCRSIYFNSRLAVIARPEYLLHGDGLARTYQQAERVTVDHWNLLSTLLKLEEQPTPSTNVQRYLTVLYSIPRKRHPRKDSKKKATQPADKVAFGFSIAHVDFNDSTIFFCCVMPWSVNGQAFDATTLLGEETTRRAKADLFLLNQQRALANPPLPPLPRLTYNYCISPFRAGSRGNVTMPRRGFETLEALAERDPNLRRECFPPLKEIWLPAKYAAALQVFVRRLESEDDMGGPPPENTPRKRVRKATSSGTSSAPPSTDNSPFPSYPLAPSVLPQDGLVYPQFVDAFISFDGIPAPQHPYSTPFAYQQDAYPPSGAQYP